MRKLPRLRFVNKFMSKLRVLANQLVSRLKFNTKHNLVVQKERKVLLKSCTFLFFIIIIHFTSFLSYSWIRISLKKKFKLLNLLVLKYKDYIKLYKINYVAYTCIALLVVLYNNYLLLYA